MIKNAADFKAIDEPELSSDARHAYQEIYNCYYAFYRDVKTLNHNRIMSEPLLHKSEAPKKSDLIKLLAAWQKINAAIGTASMKALSLNISLIKNAVVDINARQLQGMVDHLKPRVVAALEENTILKMGKEDLKHIDFQTMDPTKYSLFEAVVHQLNYRGLASVNSSVYLRLLAVGTAREHYEQFSDQFSTEKKFNQYLGMVRDGISWPGHSEIKALSIALDLEITVVNSTTQQQKIFGQNKQRKIYLLEQRISPSPVEYEVPHYHSILKIRPKGQHESNLESMALTRQYKQPGREQANAGSSSKDANLGLNDKKFPKLG